MTGRSSDCSIALANVGVKLVEALASEGEGVVVARSRTLAGEVGLEDGLRAVGVVFVALDDRAVTS